MQQDHMLLLKPAATHACCYKYQHQLHVGGLLASTVESTPACISLSAALMLTN